MSLLRREKQLLMRSNGPFRKKEQHEKKDPDTEVLYPITADKYIFSHHYQYEHAANLKAKRIRDFIQWKDHDSYQQVFQLLVKALKKEN